MRTLRTHGPSQRAAGFSMVELLVAMLITIIISGAIYAMIATGASTARREPAVADRQQNLRVSLDLMSRDIQNAGNGIPAFIQLFAATLNDGVTPMNGAGPQGPNGPTDRIQIRGNDGTCPNLAVCRDGGASLTTGSTFPPCYNIPGPILVWSYPEASPCTYTSPTPTKADVDNCCSSCSTIMWACEPGPGVNKSCTGADSDDNGHVVFPPGQAEEFNPPGGTPFTPDGVTSIGIFEWKILIDTEGVPNLWRTSFDPDSVTTSGQCSVGADSNFGWVMVARGIEDLQFQYLMHTTMGEGSEPPADPNDDSSTGWRNVPTDQTIVGGTGTAAAFDVQLVVRQVRITIGARALEAKLQGESTATNTSMTSGQTALRETMTTVVSPRASLAQLSKASPNPLYK